MSRSKPKKSCKWERLAKLAAEPNVALIERGEVVMALDSDLGVLEHLIHEVSHAVSLRLLPFTEHTSAAIGHLLDMAQKQAKDGDVREEERAWAIEWFVWRDIGLHSHFEWGDLTANAEVQECDIANIERLVDPKNPEFETIIELSRQATAEVHRYLGVEYRGVA